MQDRKISEDTINDVILKYAEESFGVRDAAKFEVLLKFNPEYSKTARINRDIRLLLQSLPRVNAAPGFEARLTDRIQKEYN